MSAERDEDLVRQSKPLQDDPAAALLRARVKRSLLGVEGPFPRVGRFVINAQRGAGSMGTVYEAHDPVLDRTIALKVLHGGTRVLPEARALAKLAHPNVVAVFDAGEADGQVFIAMELVDGQRLDRWVQTERTADEILAVLVQAGEGLMAAHEAGIVHSDFKPANVLVQEGRARVVDFSVARTVEDDPIGGTLNYMAPEHRAGQAPTPASDQYGFAVTAIEALSSVDVPDTVRRALERARAERPDQRYPSLDELLDALRPSQSSRVSWWWPVILAGVVAAALFVTRRDPCAGGEALVTRVWNEQQRSALARSIEAAKGPFAAQAEQRILAGFDTYRSTWLKAHRTTCEDTHVRGVQSDSTLDAKMACLTRQLDAASALRDELLRAKQPRAFVRGVAAVARLDPDVGACASSGQPPTVISDEVRHRADTSRAQYALGQYDAARRTAYEAERLATSPAARAEVMLQIGITEGRTGSATVAASALREALQAASNAKDDRRAAEVWPWLLKSRLFAGAYHDVVAWAPFATAAATRASLSSAEVDGIVSEALLGRGEVIDAVDALERALDGATDPQRRAIVATNLGKARLWLGDARAADAHFVEAHRIMAERLGDDHPGLGFYFEKRGRGRLALGDAEAALDWCERALAVRRDSYGREDRAVATSALCAADALITLGRLGEAAKKVGVADTIRTAIYGREHPSYRGVRRRHAALAIARRDWRVAERWLTPWSAHERHPEAIEVIALRALVLTELGSREEATRLLALAEERAALLPAKSPARRAIDLATARFDSK